MKESKTESEKLLDAMGLIDDEFLSEAYETDSPKKLKELKKKEKLSLLSLRAARSIASLAACIVIVISAFYLVPWINSQNLGIGDESSNSADGQIPNDPPTVETHKAVVSSPAPLISSVAEVAPSPEAPSPVTPTDKEPAENCGKQEDLEASREEESSEESAPEELCDGEILPENAEDILKYSVIIPRICDFSSPSN